MFTRILVLLDGSDFGDWALPLAAALARRSDAALELVHALEPYPYTLGAPAYDRRLEDELRQKTRTRLENTRERVAEYLRREVLLAWPEGPVEQALERHVAESGADLVVMTTHGRGGLSRVLLGSVADHTARHSPVPVLFVRPKKTGVTWRGEPLLRRIVIPLDGSELAESVLDHAVMLATAGETELALLRIVVPLPAGSYPNVLDGIPLDRDDLSRRQRDAGMYLERMSADLRANGFATTVRVKAASKIARAILDYAGDADADLIALATHGRGAAARFMLGSVADKILREATVPLLLYRPPPSNVANVADGAAHPDDRTRHPSSESSRLSAW
jgi:nucleotide-binding universal stress UspA family protein